MLLLACSKDDKDKYGFEEVLVGKVDCSESSCSDGYRVTGTFENFGFLRFEVTVYRLKEQNYNVEDMKKQVNQSFVDVLKVGEKSDIAKDIYTRYELDDMKIRLYRYNYNSETDEYLLFDNIRKVSLSFDDDDIILFYVDGKFHLDASVISTERGY